MTRWLQAAKQVAGVPTKLTKPTKPALDEVKSVKSVLSEGSDAFPDTDGVARTPEAIEAVWDDAERSAREYRRNNTPPTCAFCGVSDWTVNLTEPDGRKLHVHCWIESNP